MTDQATIRRGCLVGCLRIKNYTKAGCLHGPRYARRLRATRPMPNSTWHLDEMFVSIDGRKMYLWRAVDAEGEVLDILVQSKRDRRAAKRLMRKLLRKNGRSPPRSSPIACPHMGQR